MLKEINDFDPLIYESYFVAKTIEDIKIEYFTSNGYTSFEDFDVYRGSNYSLIAFLDNPDNYWITNYKISYEQNSSILQSQYYEKVLDILNDEPQVYDSFYTFCKSEEIVPVNNNLDNYIFSQTDRCDYNKYGPVSFYPAPPNKNTGRMISFRSILAVTGIGHLLRVDIESLPNIMQDVSSDQSIYQSSRTLSGAIKLIDEWRQVLESPWNNTEEIAIKAAEFLHELQIPEEVINQIRNEEPDKRLFSYLNGETDLSKMLETNQFIFESFKTYIKDNFRYKSIKNLKLFHSDGYLIDQGFVEKEHELLENVVLFYCMVNNLDRNSMTLEEISDHAYTMDHYIDHNNSITDIIRKLTM